VAICVTIWIQGLFSGFVIIGRYGKWLIDIIMLLICWFATGKTCLGGGMHCPSASCHLFCVVRYCSVSWPPNCNKRHKQQSRFERLWLVASVWVMHKLRLLCGSHTGCLQAESVLAWLAACWWAWPVFTLVAGRKKVAWHRQTDRRFRFLCIDSSV